MNRAEAERMLEKVERNLAEATLGMFECFLLNAAFVVMNPGENWGGPGYAERREYAFAEVRRQGGAALEQTWAEAVAALLDLMMSGSSSKRMHVGAYRRIVEGLEKKRDELGLNDVPTLAPNLAPDEVLDSLLAYRETMRQKYPLESMNPQGSVN